MNKILYTLIYDATFEKLREMREIERKVKKLYRRQETVEIYFRVISDIIKTVTNQ